MNAYKKYLTIDDPQQLVLINLPFKPGQKVEVIIFSEDEEQEKELENITTDETPTEIVIEGIYEGLHQAITSKTIPLEEMWLGICQIIHL